MGKTNPGRQQGQVPEQTPRAGPRGWEKVSLAAGPPGCPLEGREMFAPVLGGWGVLKVHHQEGAVERRGAQSASGTDSHSSGTFGTWPFQSWRGGGITCMSQSYWPRGCKSQGWEDCCLKNSAMVAPLGSQIAVRSLGERGGLGVVVVVELFDGRW